MGIRRNKVRENRVSRPVYPTNRLKGRGSSGPVPPTAVLDIEYINVLFLKSSFDEVTDIRDGKLSVSNSFSNGRDGSQVTETGILKVTETDNIISGFWRNKGCFGCFLDERGLLWA